MDLRYTNIWNLSAAGVVTAAANGPASPRVVIRHGERPLVDEIVTLSVNGMRLRSLPGGRSRFTIALRGLARDAAAPGAEVLAIAEAEGETWPAVTRRDGQTVFHFDIEASVRGILFEEYARPRRPFFTRLPVHYHVVPGRVRLRLKQAMTLARRALSPSEGFPSWPIDNSADFLREMFARALGAVNRGGCEDFSPPALWPEGRRYAITLTHDVDTAAGMRRIGLLRAEEERRGLRSCWNFPSHGYPLDRGVLAELRAAGHEIGCHGDSHDNRLIYCTPEEMEERVRRSRESLEEFGARGFRSPSLMRSRALRECLARHFDYDGSSPDTEVFSAAGVRSGCCTGYPFASGRLTELPLTVPQDCTLLFLGEAPERIPRVWTRKIEWIKSLGGLAVVNTHPEPHFSGNARMAAAYRTLLDRIVADAEAWIALPGEIASYWRGRGTRSSE